MTEKIETDSEVRKFKVKIQLELKIETGHKAPKFKVNNTVTINKYKNIFSKEYTGNWSREIFIIDSVLKTNPWIYKIKDLNGEKIIGSFYEKNCRGVYYKWVFIQTQIVI